MKRWREKLQASIFTGLFRARFRRINYDSKEESHFIPPYREACMARSDSVTSSHTLSGFTVVIISLSRSHNI